VLCISLTNSGEAISHTASEDIPTFYRTRRLITVFTTRYWSLSWATCIQSTPSHFISLRSNLTLSSHLLLGLQIGLFPLGFLTKILYAFLISPRRTTYPAYLLLGFILLTPWCRTLFEKLIVTQLVKKTCFLYGTRRFITVFTKARHWTLSWASRIKFVPWIPISLRSILMLYSQLRFIT
jgi:hypothetical protein